MPTCRQEISVRFSPQLDRHTKLGIQLKRRCWGSSVTSLSLRVMMIESPGYSSVARSIFVGFISLSFRIRCSQPLQTCNNFVVAWEQLVFVGPVGVNLANIGRA